MPDPTTNRNWDKPNVGGDDDIWGALLNAIWDDLDADYAVITVDTTNSRFGVLTATPSVTFQVTGASILDGAVTFNEAGAAVDFRVEGDTDVNLLFADGSADAVGIGTSTPGAKLEVAGGVIINEAGGDFDVRIEGDTDANLLVTDASTDRVGIGTATPGEKLQVAGNLAVTGGLLMTARASDVINAGEDQTVDVGAGTGNLIAVAGSGSIASLGSTAPVGMEVLIRFGSSQLTLKHSANLLLPGSIDIKTEAGDWATFATTATGFWHCTGYHRGDGKALTLPVASQAEMEAATALDKAVTPGRQQYHPSAAKAWVRFKGTGAVSIISSYNVTSVTDNEVGDYTVNLTTSLSSAAGAPLAISSSFHTSLSSSITAGSVRFVTSDNNGARQDPGVATMALFGDFA